MHRIKWPLDESGQDPFRGDDVRSRLVRSMREALEQALPDSFGPKNTSIDFVHRKLYETKSSAVPCRATFYKVFTLKASGRMVTRCLEAAGVAHDLAEALGSRNEEVRAGGQRASEAEDPHLRKRFADVAVKVREARLNWDAAEPGEPSYRDPESALPRADLSMAYDAALDGALSREDIAYCLYSAVKHNRDYRAWVTLCPASEEAAEALLDLMLVPRPGEMVRPVLRAAWTLQHLDSGLREAVYEVGSRLAADRDDGMLELLGAAHHHTVEQLLRRRLTAGFYTDEEANKIRQLIEREWQSPLAPAGARGLVDQFMRDTGISKIIELDGSNGVTAEA